MPNLNLNLPDSFGVNVEENGSNSAFDSTLNFTGAGVTVTQNGSGTGTITIPGGSGTPTNSFVFMIPITGTIPTATSTMDSLTFSSSSGTMSIVGNAGTDTLDFNSALIYTSPLSITGHTVSMTQANSTTNGWLSSTDWNTFNNKQVAGNYITALTGDVTATGPGSTVATLATVNATTGSFGSSTSIPSFTVNGKGLITSASNNVVIAPAGTLSGTTLNSTVVTSSLTSVGTITTGVWNGTVTAGQSFITSGTTYTTTCRNYNSRYFRFKFTFIGGGGGSAGVNSGNGRGAGAGGGGGVILFITGLTPSTAYTIAIGAGGTAGTSAPTAGGAGGNTTLTIGATTYTAGGGGGGPVGASTVGGLPGGGTNGKLLMWRENGEDGTPLLRRPVLVERVEVLAFGFWSRQGSGMGPNIFLRYCYCRSGIFWWWWVGGAADVGTATAGAAGGAGCILVEWNN